MNFYSHGKLLITGEYLVLKGAKALAAPVRFGQKLEVSENGEDEFLIWESFEHERLWFHAKIEPSFFKIIETSDNEIARRLLSMLLAAEQLNPGFIQSQKGKKVNISADFKLSWGLGSSSSLIASIAAWAKVDPYSLHRLISNGSGYDVVCANEKGPVFFTLKGEAGYITSKADLNPPFADQIYFIYLGNKQDSQQSVKVFLKNKTPLDKEIAVVSDLAVRFTGAKSISEFENCIEQHEQLLSSVLNEKTLKASRFSDLNGQIKSLGAWGGDFAMMTWHDSLTQLKKFLETKQINSIFAFKEIILSR
jgi:mevalonate kinase